MPKVELDVETTVSPQAVKAALLDFSDRRPEIWPGIEPSLYEVYRVGETSADIKEGSKMPGSKVWAKEHYDWSVPGVVKWTVQESNFCAPGSYVQAQLKPADGGGTRIQVEWERTPTSFFGRMAAFLIVRTKGKPVRASIEKALKKMEAASVA